MYDYLKNQTVFTSKESIVTVMTDWRGSIICSSCSLNNYFDHKFNNYSHVKMHLTEHVESSGKENIVLPPEIFNESFWENIDFPVKEFTKYTVEEQNVINDAVFNACKFARNHSPLEYDPVNEDLIHIRYAGDSTGYFSKVNRIKRAVKNFWEYLFKGKDLLGFIDDEKPSFLKRIQNRWFNAISMAKVNLTKDKHLPDATVNDNIYHWDEDAIYAVYFQPLVGMEILRFLQAEPDNPWAQRIAKTMTEVSSKTFENAKEKYSTDETVRDVSWDEIENRQLLKDEEEYRARSAGL